MPHRPNRLSRREFLLFGLVSAGGSALLYSRLFGRSPSAWLNPYPPVGNHNPMSPTTNQVRAEQAFDSLLGAFEQPGSFHFKEFSEPQPGDPPSAYLWPYLGVVSAAAALSSLPVLGERHRISLDRLLTGLETYWDASAPLPAYDSVRRDLGGGLKYYDDNEWAGLAFLDIYQLSQAREHLQRAVDSFNYSVSGWTNDMGGGIYWREQDKSTKNTCSNAPAAVLALRLFQHTGTTAYIDWAFEIMAWLERLRSPEGIYWDSINTAGQIDRRTFAYNTGAPLHAAALLFQITQDAVYLDQMRHLARSAYRHFSKSLNFNGYAQDGDRDSPPVTLDPNRIYNDTPWFNTILLRGLIAMYEVDPARDRSFIDHFRSCLDFAWEHARRPDGCFSPDWTGRSPDQRRWLLDQAAMVECYALISRFDQA